MLCADYLPVTWQPAATVVLGGTLSQAIAVVVGGVLALFGVIGGVSAYQGSPSGVAPENLYTYADA